MDIVSTLVLGTLVTAVTQGMKKLFPNVDPKLWVVLLALIGATFYGVVVPLLPAEVVEKATYVFTTAVSIYEVFKNFLKSS